MTLNTLDPPKVASRAETPATPRAADFLSLAAAPTFAIMALLTARGGGADMLCAATHNVWPPGGMVSMYVLMSLFHLAPWLRLIARAKGKA